MPTLLLALFLAVGPDLAAAPSAAPPSAAPPSAAPPSAAPTPAAKNPAAEVRRGDVAFTARDYRAALFAYQDAILIAPDNVEARVKAGQSYAKLGHDAEALAQWTRALELDPENPIALGGRSASLERQAALGKDDSSVREPRTAQALGDSAVRERRAAQAQGDSAVRERRAAPEDDSAARYTRAVALIRERKFEEGAAELDRALAQKPDFAVALVARGSARVGQGRFEDALADYSAAQRADPQLASPLLGLAETYRGLGQKERAAQLYRQYAASNAPDAQQALKEYALQSAQALSSP